MGDEGGFAPDLKDSREILELILEAVKNAGYEPGKDIGIAIDAAASELYDGEKDGYYFPGESKMTGKEGDPGFQGNDPLLRKSVG